MENDKETYHMCDELSDRLLPSLWKTANKSTIGARNYQTDFFYLNAKITNKSIIGVMNYQTNFLHLNQK